MTRWHKQSGVLRVVQTHRNVFFLSNFFKKDKGIMKKTIALASSDGKVCFIFLCIFRCMFFNFSKLYIHVSLSTGQSLVLINFLPLSNQSHGSRSSLEPFVHVSSLLPFRGPAQQAPSDSSKPLLHKRLFHISYSTLMLNCYLKC